MPLHVVLWLKSVLSVIFPFFQLVASDVFEILMALSKDPNVEKAVNDAVAEALNKAKEWGLIKAVPKED